MSWQLPAAVALGGALGALARWGMSGLTHRLLGDGFPFGTLAVNAAGCLAIGAVLYLALERGHLSPAARLLIVTGFLGSLTTFSTFGHETVELLRSERIGAAMGNVLLNVCVGLAAVAGGWWGTSAVAGQESERVEMESVSRSEPDQVHPADVFDARTMRVNATNYAYRVYVPEGEMPEGGWPGILFLHGKGECGDDNLTHIGGALPMVVVNNAGDWPFVVIAPQKPTQESEWEDHAKMIRKVLGESVDDGVLDPERLAITGLSQGGHGSLSLTAMHPEMFRAVAAVCPYVNPPASWDSDLGVKRWGTFDGATAMVDAIAEACVDLPVKIWHGDADPAVPVSESVGIAKVLSRLGGNPELTIYQGADHLIWDRVYATPGLAEWFARVTDLSSE